MSAKLCALSKLKPIIVCLAMSILVTTIRLSEGSERGTLPSDLIFETINLPLMSKPGNRSYLVRVAATTSKTTVFYTNSDWNVHPLEWSPSGKQFAVILYDDISQICLLNRSGQLQTCMAEKVPNALTELNYMVSWSPDEQKFYYLTFDDDYYTILEADTNTGKTLRAIYKTQFDLADFAPFSWTRMLDYVVINADNPAFDVSALLVKLPTQAGMQSVEPPLELIHPITFQKSTISDPTFAQHFLIPCSFSPQDNYIAAYDEHKSSEPALLFTIMDKQGNERYRLNDANQPIPKRCPAWQNDEQAFYFPVYTKEAEGVFDTSIYKYTLSTNQLAPYYNAPHTLFLSSPLQVSPDGKYLAFETLANPDYKPTEDMPPRASGIGVIEPNNHISYYSSVYVYGRRPVWVPPLQ